MSDPGATLGAFALVAIALHLFRALRYPRRKCWRCDGEGKFSSGRSERPCRRCDGTGARARLVSRILWRRH